MDRSQYRGALYKSSKEKQLSRKTKHKRTVPRVLLYAILSGVLLVSICILALTPKLYINTILIEGGRAEVQDLVRSRVEAYLSTKRGFFFSNQNQIILSADTLETSLVNTLGILDTAKVKREGLNTISIAVAEREPVFITRVGDETMHISSDGFVFVPASQNEAERELPILEISSESLAVKQSPGIKDYVSVNRFTPLQLVVGSYILPAEQFDNLHLVIDELGARNMRVQKVVIFSERHAELYIENSKEGRFLFDITGDITKQLATYDSAKKTQDLRDKIQTNRQELKYIDLRTPGKVFYKF